MGNPLVSIIMPAYNHENYIEETLESIINQDYQNIELIIFNDGSKDKTGEKIEAMEQRLKQRFTRYIYISKDNEGICKTLNKGLDLAAGDYIVPFPSDDVMYPQRIRLQVEYFINHPYFKMIYTNGYLVRSKARMNLNIQYPEHDKFSSYLQFFEGYLFDFMLVNVFKMPTPSIMIAKECYSMVGKYDEDLLCEDPDMFIKISRFYCIGCIKDPLILHRMHGTNAGNPNIVVPSVLKMKEKYDKSPLFTKDQREKLYQTFKIYTGV